jgi:drug/metabolite transporter (DMT)-like permease
MALIHTINIYLAGRMESAFFFPAINGSCIFATVLASVFIFKEKLTRLQKISITIGIVAILLVGNITDLIIK